jgi:predicted TPR repeat methyltransferase
MRASGAPTAHSNWSLVQRVDYIVEQSRNKRVLHLGCTNWPYTDESRRAGTLLHDDLAAVASELWGVDSNRDGLDALRAHGYERLCEADLERVDRSDELREAAPFEVVVAGEVLEHLSDPGAALRGVRQLLAPDSVLVVTVPNAYCAFRFAAYAVRGRRGRSEPGHPDHVAYYTGATLRRLLESQGFEVDQVCFYDLGVEHRPHAPRSWRVVNDVAVRVAPQLADGVIAACRVAHD